MSSRADEEEAADERRMSFFEHLEELRQRLKIVILAFVVVFIVFMTFSLQSGLLGIPIPLPVPSLDPKNVISSQFLRTLMDEFIPANVTTVALTPWEVIVVQFKAALFLSAVVISPVSTYQFWAFIRPALRAKERRLIIRISAPVVLLFLAGVAMSFLVVLPFTIRFLYDITGGIVDESLFQIQEFLDFILLFSLAFGVAFELPVVMYGLSVIGIIEPVFWRRNWRYAAIAIFVFGAFITPDGSGVTMMIVSIPMLLLYVGGYGATVLRKRRLDRAKS